MKKLLLLTLAVLGLQSVTHGQTFAFSSPTNALAAGTPSRAISIQITGTIVSTATFTLSDSGAGGSFYPTAPVITGSTNGSTGFFYVPAAGATGSVVLSATATGGMTGSNSISLSIETNASIAAQDQFSGTSGTNLTGTTATSGGTWTVASGSGPNLLLNGSNGWYVDTTSGSYIQEYLTGSSAATNECDTQVTISNWNASIASPGVAGLSATSSLQAYRVYYSSGWNLYLYNGVGGGLLFTDTTTEVPTTSGTYTVMMSVRLDLSGNHWVYVEVNGVVLNGGVPVQSNFLNCSSSYGGFIEGPNSSASTTEDIRSNFKVTNVDWFVPSTFTVLPSTIPANHSGNITLTLTGSGTSWTGSTTFSTSGVSGVTVVSKANTSSTSETLTISDGSGTGALGITGSDGSAGSATVATALLSVSPASGNIGTTPTITLTGTNTIWTHETASTLFSVSGGTGDSIASITVISDTSATAVLTVGSATGTLTITDNSTTATTSFTAANTTIVTFPNSNVFLSPYNWRLPGDGTAWSPGPGGPYMKFSVTGTTAITANVDTTINSGPATDYPTFKVIVNDRPATFIQLTSGATTETLASGLTSGDTYTVVMYVIDGGTGAGNGWSGTGPMAHIQSLQFDGGATVSPYPIIRPKNCFVLGDSFLTGYNGLTYTSGTTPYYTVVDPSMTWANYMAYAMNCEVGIVGVGSQGYTAAGNNSYPSLPSTWDHYDSTHARSFSPAPDYVINAEGVNDHGISSVTMQADVQSWLTAVRSALPSAAVFLYIPVGGESSDETGTGGANATPIRNAVAAQGDPNVFLIDSGTALVTADNWSYTTWFSPNDGLHPAQTSHGILASYAVQWMQKALGGSGIHAYAFSN
jgi:hypothetical protein